MDELSIASMTQTPEEIQKVLESSGHTVTETQVLTDGPLQNAQETEQPAETKPASEHAEETAATEQTPAPAKPKKNTFKALRQQIRELNQKLADQERTISEMKTPAETKTAAPAKEAAVETDEDPAPQAPGPKPNFEDEQKYPLGQYDPQYIEDLADWRYDVREHQRITKEKEKRAQAKAKAAEEKKAEPKTEAKPEPSADDKLIQERWAAELASQRAKNPEFEKLLEKTHDKIVFSNVMGYVLPRLERGGDVLFYLGQNPDVAHRIASATTLSENATRLETEKAIARAFKELGKLEDQLAPQDPPEPEDEEIDEVEQAKPEDPKPAKKEVVTPAAPPPSPVGSRAAVAATRVTELPPEKLRSLDPDEYRRQVESARRRG